VPLRQVNLRLPLDVIERARTDARRRGISLSRWAHEAFVEKLAYERGVKEGRGARHERDEEGPR
jgi:hypothetical protein